MSHSTVFILKFMVVAQNSMNFRVCVVTGDVINSGGGGGCRRPHKIPPRENLAYNNMGTLNNLLYYNKSTVADSR